MQTLLRDLRYGARRLVKQPCFLLMAMLASVSMAQTPRPPAVTSPQLLPDRNVILRLYAPNANEVKVAGDWLRRGESPTPLEKGADGVWSVTIGPLPPAVYGYAFLVDGVRASDPANPRAVLAAGRSASSLIEVRGETRLPWEERNVPRGALHFETYHSALQNTTRRFMVYTPPGYHAKGGKKYPALVLLPGTPGDERDWVNTGLAPVILDNLLAEGKLVEMLVLMPPADVLLKGGSRADNLMEFESLLLKEFLPRFEQRYRALARPESRAIAGLSLGGELALTVGLRHPETFRWVASLSGSLFEKDFPDRFNAFLEHPTPPKLLWIGCGAGDLFLPGAKKLSEILTAKGVKHTFRETEGYHTWLVWRPYLAEILPLLFR